MGKVIEREKRTIAFMIRLYCRYHLHLSQPDKVHAELIDYCQRRLDRCHWQDRKPPCKYCSSHCYAPRQREEVRRVMRWTGPRMIFFAPIEVIRHLFGKG
ncbi:nitrous oxide-stimulated promoter family protein [Hallella multisaccharivorax]|uniref:Nitrous oxide-stimulated promoter n=1 Tax=Hallella multisaccharivorax DSM 17128 TaxID=688246 RepID=F8N7Y3_9BACT|nr:nitrous oxide-stimulated promoter family protein [Hallella multisaccharivorax]EGN57529.1 hypothetical protein Premu_2139 [Hallella multisaccharivorax DSM 17128]